MDASKKTVLMLSSVMVMTAFGGVSYADNDALTTDSADMQNKTERDVLETYSIKVSQPNGKTYKTSVNLNLRIGDSVNDSVITTMPSGSNVKHLGTTDKGWYKLEFNGKVGYAHKKYLTQGSSDNKNNDSGISVTNPSGAIYKTVVNLNLRTGNTTNSSVIMTMPKGSSVKHLGTTSNGWFKLEFNGKVGYAHEMYLTQGSVNNEVAVKKANGEIYTTVRNLNLRTGDTTNHSIITTMPKGSVVKHIGTTNNGWFKLEYNGKIGYSHKKYLTQGSNNTNTNSNTDTSTKLITQVNLNMRTGSSTSDGIITTIPAGETITVLSNSNGWSKVRYGRNEGFVSSKYLQESNGGGSGSSNGKEVNKKSTKTTPARQKLVDVSSGLVGKVPYFWGGKSNTTGWNPEWNNLKEVTEPGSSTTGKSIPFGLDCSGFIDWSYRTAGLGNIFSAGGTAHQWDNSYAINRADALPGDLVFKQGPGASGVNHIGIYIGEGNGGQSLVVHSSYSRGGVVLTTVKQAGLSYFRRAKNIF